jgi:hypothetical protein
MSTRQRLKLINIEKVLPLIGGPIKSEERTDVEGVAVHVTGLRLATFKHKGLSCCKCGIEAKYFAFERTNKTVVHSISIYTHLIPMVAKF